MNLPIVRRLMPFSGVLFAMMLAVFAMPTVSEAAEDALKIAAQDFQSSCASCHGWGGAGDGPVADVLTIKPPDLTRIAQRNGGSFAADEVYKSIEGLDMPRAHGTKQMPVWGRWFSHEAIADSLYTGDSSTPPLEKVAKRIRGLVAYLKSIQQ